MADAELDYGVSGGRIGKLLSLFIAAGLLSMIGMNKKQTDQCHRRECRAGEKHDGRTGRTLLGQVHLIVRPETT
ncbi:MAG: hypothetical protein D4R77_03040 [Planctomycetaceae bacterium]|nr:MAG: hypothetical protein D4R77_03040 [Planctomycetaceae bacterium]